jgi:hypothetical protein
MEESIMSKRIRSLTLAVPAVPILALALAAPTVKADTIYVCRDGSGDYLTIQGGIDAASDGDEVVVCDATYTGAGNKDLDFGGKAITVRSENGPDNCIIDCEAVGRGLFFHSGETQSSVVSGFTITDGQVELGGAVYCTQGSPAIRNCTIIGNSALDGGALYCHGSPTISNCTITGNGALSSAGGIFCHEYSQPIIESCAISANTSYFWAGGVYCGRYSSPAISSCTISGNNVPADGAGGGIYCPDSSPTISDCAIMENSATVGAGLCCVASTDATIINCTIAGNTADSRGGGILCGAATIMNCAITNNSASCGGGICCSGGNPMIRDCTIAGNMAQGEYYPYGHGGGVYCDYDSVPLISGCAITANLAQGEGGGIFCGDPTITSCIIAKNTAQLGGAIRCVSSTAMIANCAICANSATYGAGVHCYFYSFPVISNCVVTANVAAQEGGGLYCFESWPILSNCILWSDTPDEVCASSAEPHVVYSDVEGSWPGTGNIDVDPLFVDPDGPDDDPNTWQDNDYHLSAGSPCIDAACNWGVPPDVADLDEDGDTDESTPLDLDAEGRFFDDPNTDDTGCGCPPVVDMGAYEFGGTGPQPCPGDLDCDRGVDQSDLGILLAAWQTTGAGDLNCDGNTDQTDLGILLAHWGQVCP